MDQQSHMRKKSTKSMVEWQMNERWKYETNKYYGRFQSKNWKQNGNFRKLN